MARIRSGVARRASRVAGIGGAWLTLAACSVAPPPAATRDAPRATPALSAADAAFLDTLERRTFDWFWDTTNPRNGLTPDRWPTRSFSSVAAVGFALTAYPIGVERGWITRAQARDRTLATLRFFWTAPQGAAATGVTGYRGFYYHFLDMESGLRFQRVELSTIDTALLLGGVLFAREYYGGGDGAEQEVRALADSIYRRVDWRWAQSDRPVVTMGWHPEPGLRDHDAGGFIRASWVGYDEAMLLYALALGSPTHPVDPSAWSEWTKGYEWGTFHGQEHVNFAPLFGHQYSHVWIDFRGIRDAYMQGKGIDYFENSRRATLAQRAYATANPGGWRGYSADVWGLTASDGPKDTTMTIDGAPRRFHTYWARGAALDEINDDGTIAPTAAGGSIPFAPDETIAALRTMRERYGDALFTRYGFLDSFNPTLRDTTVRVQHGRVVAGVGWFDGDHLGIDQGPIVSMIENHRTGLVWETMKRSPYVVRGLCRAGFTGGWLSGRC